MVLPRDMPELGLLQLEFPCLSKEKKEIQSENTLGCWAGNYSQRKNLPLIPHPVPRFVFTLKTGKKMLP